MRAVSTHEFTLGNLSVSDARRPPVCKVVAWKYRPDARTLVVLENIRKFVRWRKCLGMILNQMPPA